MLTRQPAAVDGENMPLHIVRLLRGQKDRSAADVGGIAPAPRRDELHHLPVARLAGLPHCGVARPALPGRDRVSLPPLRRLSILDTLVRPPAPLFRLMTDRHP